MTLETIASLTDGESTPWKTFRDGRPDLQRTLDAIDHFRRDSKLVIPRSFTDLWPTLLWLAAVTFLADVAIRRIAPDWARIRHAVDNTWRQFRGQETTAPTEYLEKLKSRKAEVGESIDRTRAATRFEASTSPTGRLSEDLIRSLHPGQIPLRPGDRSTTRRPPPETRNASATGSGKLYRPPPQSQEKGLGRSRKRQG